MITQTIVILLVTVAIGTQLRSQHSDELIDDQKKSQHQAVPRLRLAVPERQYPPLTGAFDVTELIVIEKQPEPDPNAVYLAKREYEISALVSKGLQNKEIGRLLGIADSTVKVVLKAIYRKLRINSRVKLALIFHHHERELQKQAREKAAQEQKLPPPQGAAAA